MDLSIADEDPSRAEIDTQVSDLEDWLVARDAAARGVSQSHADAREQLPRPERLGQIVVRARVESLYLVLLLSSRR